MRYISLFLMSLVMLACGGGGGGGGNDDSIDNGDNGGPPPASPWSAQPAPGSLTLYDIHFANASRGWAVGADHHGVPAMLHTTDGGDDWVEVLNHGESTPLEAFRGVHFVDNQTGWAVGGGNASTSNIVRSTSDGGETWLDHWPISPTAMEDGAWEPFNGVFFLDQHTGWVVGNQGVIFATTDGGTSWQSQEPPPGAHFNLLDVFFADADRGWISTASGWLLRTDDGGADWEVLGVGVSPHYDMHFLDAGKGWVAGTGGRIRYTENGGESWTTRDAGTELDLYAVHFLDEETGWVAGEQGLILHTDDGGESWHAQDSETDETLRALHFSASGEGWVAGLGSTIRHHALVDDGGDNGNGPDLPEGWNAHQVEEHLDGGVIIPVFGAITDLFPLDAAVGWMIIEQRVLGTTDGGDTWSRLYERPDARSLNAMHFVDDEHGWLVGGVNIDQGPLIVHTDNGGETWAEQSVASYPDPNQFYDLHDVFFADSQIGWAVGTATILHTSDGGETWSVQADYTAPGSGNVSSLNGVHFIDGQTGWAVGMGRFSSEPGALLHTTDGGDSWIYSGAGTPAVLNDVFFSDAMHGWVVGERSCCGDALVLRTTDGGNSWSEVEPPNVSRLRSVHALNQDQVWVSGAEGTLLFTSDGGDTWHEHDSETQAQINRVRFAPGGTPGWSGSHGSSFLRYGAP